MVFRLAMQELFLYLCRDVRSEARTGGRRATDRYLLFFTIVLNMKILHKPTATVGQIIKDLELIVAKSSDIYLEFSNDDGNDMYVEGIKLRKDIAILESTGNEKRAATVEDMLAMFRLLDKSLGVVMQDGWELLNFEPNKDGSVFWYDEEDDYCLFRLGRDVRLVTTEQMEKELKEKGLDKCLDFKVAVALRKLKMAYRVNCVRRNYGKLCLCYSDDEEEQNITLASLLEEFPDCAEFMILLDGKYYTVDVDENGIFFKFQNEEGGHLGLFVGERVYDPREEWE